MNEYTRVHTHREELMREAEGARMAGEARRATGPTQRPVRRSLRWLARTAAGFWRGLPGAAAGAARGAGRPRGTRAAVGGNAMLRRAR